MEVSIARAWHGYVFDFSARASGRAGCVFDFDACVLRARFLRTSAKRLEDASYGMAQPQVSRVLGGDRVCPDGCARLLGRVGSGQPRACG